ncbi:MAG: SRPBCC domain-containing protein [Phycisphaerae bacterium]
MQKAAAADVVRVSGSFPDSLVHEAIVFAPAQQVWDAFMTNDGRAAWMTPVNDCDVRPGGLIKCTYQPGGDLDGPAAIHQRILAMEPGRMVALQTVRAPADFPFPSILEAHSVMTLEPLAEGVTRVRMNGMNWPDTAEGRAGYDFFLTANKAVFKQLKAHLDTPAETRSAAAERVMDVLHDCVGGAWVHAQEQAGKTFRARSVYELAGDGRTVVNRSWLGDAAAWRHHGDMQVWREPLTDVVRFQNVNDWGHIARGEIRLLQGETAGNVAAEGEAEATVVLEWGWHVTTPAGETRVYKVRHTQPARDPAWYRFKLDQQQPDGTWHQQVNLTFNRVEREE